MSGGVIALQAALRLLQMGDDDKFRLSLVSIITSPVIDRAC
ncbi:hypothetical protein XIS1_1150003 [Xenorhabdus innexi]|uniref:Uncharacterized protein n=1 Tax=Xenorhabdus innexi TaxID=290109 RepID=A0A1N6MRC5_9GAMM|nr:hypothetical protein XIS1_1150003 [Xenorhabdus innexi]